MRDTDVIEAFNAITEVTDRVPEHDPGPPPIPAHDAVAEQRGLVPLPKPAKSEEQQPETD
jgi:hypothetical protein